MLKTKATVLIDTEGGQSSNRGGYNVQQAAAILRRDFLVLDQRDEHADQSHESESGMDHSKCGHRGHVMFPP